MYLSVEFIVLYSFNAPFSLAIFQMTKLIESLENQVSDKGKEINAYVEKHNIQVKGGAPNKKAPEEAAKENEKKTGSGVLVSSDKS